MELNSAPGRQFKTYSMWLLIITGLFDLAVVMLKTLADLHVMSMETLAIVNAVLVFLTGAAKLVLQNIEVSEEQKAAIVDSALSLPVKDQPPPQ